MSITQFENVKFGSSCTLTDNALTTSSAKKLSFPTSAGTVALKSETTQMAIFEPRAYGDNASGSHTTQDGKVNVTYTTHFNVHIIRQGTHALVLCNFTCAIMGTTTLNAGFTVPEISHDMSYWLPLPSTHHMFLALSGAESSSGSTTAHIGVFYIEPTGVIKAQSVRPGFYSTSFTYFV